MKPDDVFVFELTKRLDFLRDHVRHFDVVVKVKDFNGHLSFYNFIVSQENGAEPALSKLTLHVKELHPDLVVKVLAYRKGGLEFKSLMYLPKE